VASTGLSAFISAAASDMVESIRVLCCKAASYLASHIAMTSGRIGLLNFSRGCFKKMSRVAYCANCFLIRNNGVCQMREEADQSSCT
jgi:hypothetical protein